MGPTVEKEKDKKKKSAFKSVAAVTKSWGNKLSPKLEMKKVKSKVALMKVCYVVNMGRNKKNSTSKSPPVMLSLFIEILFFESI